MTRTEKNDLIKKLKSVKLNLEHAIADIDLRGETEGVSGSAQHYITEALNKLEDTTFAYI